MKHLPSCAWTDTSGCFCADRIFLASASLGERLEWEARHTPLPEWYRQERVA